MMKMRHPEDADDLAELEQVWQAECEKMHRVFLQGGMAYFEEREAQLRREGRS